MSAQDRLRSEPRPEQQIFLERSGYRQRRIADAARLVPVVGLILWSVPLVWPHDGEEGAITTSTAMIYMFAIWFALILLGAFLASKISPVEPTSTEETFDEVGPVQEGEFPPESGP